MVCNHSRPPNEIVEHVVPQGISLGVSAIMDHKLFLLKNVAEDAQLLAVHLQVMEMSVMGAGGIERLTFFTISVLNPSSSCECIPGQNDSCCFSHKPVH